MIATFRRVALAEAVTYLVLLGAVVLYRVFDGPDFIGILGPIHGILFLVYLALALKVREDQGWNLWETVLVIIAAAIPLGAVVVARRLVDRAPAASA